MTIKVNPILYLSENGFEVFIDLRNIHTVKFSGNTDGMYTVIFHHKHSNMTDIFVNIPQQAKQRIAKHFEDVIIQTFFN